MLFAYLFNLAGYNLFFQYSIRQSDERIIQQLDNNQYNDSQLIEVKIKLNLPYLSDWSGYERYDGEVEFAGVHYNYVKRKIYQDTLYILCVPNQIKTELYKGSNRYLVNVNDIPSGKDGSNSVSKKSVSIDEYKQQVLLYDFTVTPLQSIATDYSHPPHISCQFMGTPGKPPEFIG